ncbi:hypothetical protein [Streptomyces niveus]|uniref:hypothetical protein n=1 Tax=Streptomyces niveus TaxID=193462 RepID=UPI0036558D74
MRSLLDSGALGADWADTFRAVPRAWFLPDLIWAYDMGTGRSVPVSRAGEPDAWERAAYANVPLVTQWDDGRHSGTGPGVVATSSASMPSVVAAMLRDLDVPAHPDFPGDAVASRTPLPLGDLGARHESVRFLRGLRVPDCAHVVNRTGEAAGKAWFFDLRGRSWAVADFREGEAGARVHQSGPRRLWDEVEAAVTWWVGQGRPGVERFGLAVEPGGRARSW